MNILSIADSFTGLFPSKITVTFVNIINDKVIDTCKLNKTDLPASFKKPTTMMISGEVWRVLRVVYLGKKKITIYVVDAANEAEFDIHNYVPTRAYPIPEISAINKDPDLIIDIDAWRQFEFLPSSMLPLITEEFAKIEVLNAEGGLLGYKNIHVREKFTMPSYQLPVEEFINIGEILENVFIRHLGYVKHGFALRSAYNSYYGIIQDNYISLLCLENFDGVNEELFEVLEKYEIILVDWCTPQAVY
jgi:hypothetical protein